MNSKIVVKHTKTTFISTDIGEGFKAVFEGDYGLFYITTDFKHKIPIPSNLTAPHLPFFRNLHPATKQNLAIFSQYVAEYRFKGEPLSTSFEKQVTSKNEGLIIKDKVTKKDKKGNKK